MPAHEAQIIADYQEEVIEGFKLGIKRGRG